MPENCSACRSADLRIGTIFFLRTSETCLGEGH